MITTIGYATPEQAKAAKTTRNEETQLKEACQGFEALFMHQMLKTMRTATIEGGLLKKSNAEKIFTDMLDQELADIESKSGTGGGIADLLFAQMSGHLKKIDQNDAKISPASIKNYLDNSSGKELDIKL